MLESIMNILYDVDLEGLAEMYCPEDEYSYEANCIMNYMDGYKDIKEVTVQQLMLRVGCIFKNSFMLEDENPFDRYDVNDLTEIAKRVIALYK